MRRENSWMRTSGQAIGGVEIPNDDCIAFDGPGRGRRSACVRRTIDLEPFRSRARPITALGFLGHDPFQAQGAGVPKQGLALGARDMAREQQAVSLPVDESGQLRAARGVAVTPDRSRPSRAGRTSSSPAAALTAARWKSGWPSSRRHTASPSSTSRSTGSARMAFMILGKLTAQFRPLRVQRRTPSPSLRAMMRLPSYFSS